MLLCHERPDQNLVKQLDLNCATKDALESSVCVWFCNDIN